MPGPGDSAGGCEHCLVPAALPAHGHHLPPRQPRPCGYLISTGDYPLPAGNSPLPSGDCPLHTGNCSLPAGNTPLPISERPLPTGDYPFSTCDCPPSTGNCPLPTSDCPLPMCGHPLPTGDLPFPTDVCPLPLGDHLSPQVTVCSLQVIIFSPCRWPPSPYDASEEHPLPKHDCLLPYRSLFSPFRWLFLSTGDFLFLWVTVILSKVIPSVDHPFPPGYHPLSPGTFSHMMSSGVILLPPGTLWMFTLP